MQPQPQPYYALPLPKAKRTNCFKPLVGCTLGPLLVMALGLTCIFACISIVTMQGPEPPLGDDFEPNPVEAAVYEESVIQSLEQAVNSDGTFTVQIAAEGLSSWINTEYKTLFEEYDIPRPFIWDYSNPQFQIGFENGVILFYVENQIALVTASGLVTAAVAPPNTELNDYLIDIDIVSIESMGINLEDDSLTLSAYLTELITDQLEQYQTETGVSNLEVTEVTSEDGVLTLRGRIVTE